MPRMIADPLGRLTDPHLIGIEKQMPQMLTNAKDSKLILIL